MNRFLILLTITVIAACGTESVKTAGYATSPTVQNAALKNNIVSGAPAWVTKGTHFQRLEDSRIFYGVGFSPVMGDMALQKATADDRARAEVERIFLLMMDLAARDYLLLAKSENIPLDENLTRSQIKDASLTILRNTRISGSWREIKTQTTWVSAALNLSLVKTKLAEIKELDERFKSYFEVSANVVFERLAGKIGSQDK